MTIENPFLHPSDPTAIDMVQQAQGDITDIEQRSGGAIRLDYPPIASKQAGNHHLRAMSLDSHHGSSNFHLTIEDTLATVGGNSEHRATAMLKGTEAFEIRPFASPWADDLILRGHYEQSFRNNLVISNRGIETLKISNTKGNETITTFRTHEQLASFLSQAVAAVALRANTAADRAR